MDSVDQQSSGQHFADQLQNRLIDFAVRVIAVSDRLPSTSAGKHVAGQLLRAGTSPAPNYGEARAAESRDDFLHKLGIVHKELNESYIWLQIITRSAMIPKELMHEVIDECDQLCRIVGASRSTARSNSENSNSRRWRSS